MSDKQCGIRGCSELRSGDHGIFCHMHGAPPETITPADVVAAHIEGLREALETCKAEFQSDIDGEPMWERAESAIDARIAELQATKETK